jgi:predicted Zn-dependent protease
MFIKALFLFCFLLPATTLIAQRPPVSSPPAASPVLAPAQDLVNSGHLDEALSELNKLAAQSPEPSGVERLKGKIFYLKNSFGEADAAFVSAIKQDPSDREASQLRGVVLFRLGKSSEAIPLLEHSHGMIPGTNVDSTYVLALCLMEAQRYQESRQAFATLYGFHADSAAANLLAAQMFMRWEKLEASSLMAHRALELAPQTPGAHLILGQIALGATNLEQASLQFKQEITLNPVSGPAYEHLGDVLIRKQMYPEAQDALNRAILLEPYATGPFILLGQALLKRNEAGLALSYLQHAEQMDGSNILTHLTLMQAYRATGRRDEAAREAKLAQDLQKAKADH